MNDSTVVYNISHMMNAIPMLHLTMKDRTDAMSDMSDDIMLLFYRLGTLAFDDIGGGCAAKQQSIHIIYVALRRRGRQGEGQSRLILLFFFPRRATRH